MSSLVMVAGVLAALCVVLALLIGGMHGLRGLMGARRGAAGSQLTVLRQIALGPKQGIAVVRVCERTLVVSTGEGGVHMLTELAADEAATMQDTAPVVPFAARLRSALDGRAARLTRAAALSIALLAAPSLAVHAQAPVAAEPAGAAAVTPAEGAAAALAGTPRLDVRLGDGSDDDVRVTGTVGAVITLGVLTLLPALLLLMTSFTRILIVLHFLRMALGTQTAPPGQLLAALALLLTCFVMAPTIERVNDIALAPFMAGDIDQGEMLRTGVGPFRAFMIAQTPEQDIAKFVELAHDPAQSVEEVRLITLMSAFATSELRAAFQMGFAIFLPFIVIDLVVSAVLTGMGMFMLPPTMIALPCKLLLFVLVDGWSLMVESLIASFR